MRRFESCRGYELAALAVPSHGFCLLSGRKIHAPEPITQNGRLSRQANQAPYGVGMVCQVMRTNIRPIHWLAAPPLTGLMVLAGTFPVSEDPYGPNCGSVLASEVSCDPATSLIWAAFGAAVMLGVLVWSHRWQTRNMRGDSS